MDRVAVSPRLRGRRPGPPCSGNWPVSGSTERPPVHSLLIALAAAGLTGCGGESVPGPEAGPTPYELAIPEGFPPMAVPPDNPMTEEGVALGRRLFFDPILSADSATSCATCHRPEFVFGDSEPLSRGFGGPTRRNSMPLANAGWARSLFSGRIAVSGRRLDYGRFKSPGMRNVEFTAPYMHDGRFRTLEEVLDHYDSGLHLNEFLDPLLLRFREPRDFTREEREALVAFLLTLSDREFTRPMSGR